MKKLVTSAPLASPAARKLFPVVTQTATELAPSQSASSISIAQFNILGSNLASPAHFPYVKPENLAWKRRKHTLLDEIKQLALPSSSSSSPPTRPVDVLCVQELTDYWEFFKDELGQLGYASVYVKRPSIHGTSWSGIEKHDGCGIFFNGDRFKLVMEKSINYKDEHDRVALMVLLEDRQPSRARRNGEDRPEEGDETETERDLVLVATTHLYWDATKVDDQMKQLREVGKGIEEMRGLAERKYKQSRLPVFFCGDFNNSPQSPIYRYMRDEIGSSSARMRSAYDVYGLLHRDHDRVLLDSNPPEGEQEPPHTTVTSRRCWTIDYIWYTPAYARPTHLLEVPEETALRGEDGPDGWVERENDKRRSDARRKGNVDEAEVGLLQHDVNYNGLPNSVFGSDHLPLMAVFEMMPQ